MPLVFTAYDVARNSHDLHSNFSIPRATSYSVNSQATIHIFCSAQYLAYSSYGHRQQTFFADSVK